MTLPVFFFNDTATTEIYTLSLHDALPISATCRATLMLSLHTQAARPYTVLFASSTASRGVRKVIAARTGPKISCCATMELGCTLLNSVGGKYKPREGTGIAGCQQVAPSATP